MLLHSSPFPLGAGQGKMVWGGILLLLVCILVGGGAENTRTQFLSSSAPDAYPTSARLVWTRHDAQHCLRQEPLADVGEACTARRPCKTGYLACVNGTCVFPREGSACTEDHECHYLSTRCLHGHCTQLRQSGDPCTEGMQCGSGNCSQGVCTGIKEGEECRVDSRGNPCLLGLYCATAGTSAGTCIRSGSEGAVCSAAFHVSSDNLLDACVAGSFCSFEPKDTVVEGQCVRFNQIAEGKACGRTWAPEWQCQPHLRCVGGGEFTAGQCKPVSSCGGVAACPQTQFCDCANGTSGTCINSMNVQSCVAEFDALTACLHEHKCPNSAASSPYNYLREMSCASKCRSEWEAQQCCLWLGFEATYGPYSTVKCSNATKTIEDTIREKKEERTSQANRTSDGVVVLLIILSGVVAVMAVVLAVRWARSESSYDPLNN